MLEQKKKTISIPQNLISYSDELYHYGTKRHSGRYPFGSGERPFQSDPQKRAARKEKIREFGQKAKRIAVPAAKIAATTAASVAVSSLTTGLTRTALATAVGYLSKNNSAMHLMVPPNMASRTIAQNRLDMDIRSRLEKEYLNVSKVSSGALNPKKMYDNPSDLYAFALSNRGKNLITEQLKSAIPKGSNIDPKTAHQSALFHLAEQSGQGYVDSFLKRDDIKNLTFGESAIVYKNSDGTNYYMPYPKSK